MGLCHGAGREAQGLKTAVQACAQKECTHQESRPVPIRAVDITLYELTKHKHAAQSLVQLPRPSAGSFCWPGLATQSLLRVQSQGIGIVVGLVQAELVKAWPSGLGLPGCVATLLHEDLINTSTLIQKNLERGSPDVGNPIGARGPPQQVQKRVALACL